MEIRFYLRMIQRGWWLIAISIVIAVNGSLINSYFFSTQMYEAGARFIVSPNMNKIDSGRDLVNSLETLDKRSIVATYGEIIKSRQIFIYTIEQLGGDPEDFANYAISVTVLPDANILRLAVQGPDKENVAILANAIGKYSIEAIQNLYQVYNINFLDYAEAPSEPYKPQPLSNAGLAFLMGAIIGVGLAILREQLSSSMIQLSQRRLIDAESLAYTRASFDDQSRKEISNSSDSVLSLGFVYLNGIQDLIDSIPQAYVNQIMRRVTDTVRYHLRGNDIIGRWSKLQFCILLPTTLGEPASHILERIRKVLSQPLSLDSKDQSLDVNLDPRIGIAARNNKESYSTLVSNAKKALEIARQSEKKTKLFEDEVFRQTDISFD